MRPSVFAAAVATVASTAAGHTLPPSNATAGDYPFWGCGILGPIPGITQSGAAEGTQKLIDGLKKTNKHDGKVSYWNWNYAPETQDGVSQLLTKDFVFMPEVWGVDAANDEYIRKAHVANFLDGNGKVSPALMGDIFLGANEPDITGSCMGDMMGTCVAPCTDPNACPVAHLHYTHAAARPPKGQCNCYSDSHATGCGFWPVPGCAKQQPLPSLFDGTDQGCVNGVLAKWRQTVKSFLAKGYKYTTGPLVAANMKWQARFIEEACRDCTSITCGCPTHVGWHFYANDCRPESTNGYKQFQEKLDATRVLMERFPHLKGAVVNEVGMLNCAMDSPDSPCVPNGPTQHYPALKQPDHACPDTDELPNGLGTFVEELIEMAGKAVTSDGRRVVVSFTWFNENMDGGTYNLRLFNDDGSVNKVGDAYISACSKWASGVQV